MPRPLEKTIRCPIGVQAKSSASYRFSLFPHSKTLIQIHEQLVANCSHTTADVPAGQNHCVVADRKHRSEDGPRCRPLPTRELLWAWLSGNRSGGLGDSRQR